MPNFAKSTLWSIFQRYFPSLIHILSTLVITRMLLPSDFGEVALVLTFYQIASLIIQSGLGDGLIYNVNNSRVLYSTVFYTNLGVAAFLYILLFVFSDTIASFYEIPRLSILTKVISLNLITFSCAYVQRYILIINQQFKKLAIISLISATVGSVVGITLAYLNFNVWAIVFMTLIQNLVEAVLLWLTTNWTPVFSFSFEELKKILPYSIRVFLNSFVQVFYDNIYSLVVGKVYNAKSLGYYNRMQTIVYYTTTNFMFAIESVFFPLLCKRKEDKDNIALSYERLLRVSTFLTFPVLIFLIGLAKPVIVFVLTEKWEGGAEVLQLLSTAFLFVPILSINNSFLKIVNRTDVLFYSNIIKKIIGVIILIVATHFDLRVLCCSIILYYFIDAAISMFCAHKYVGISFGAQIKMLKNNIILNAVGLVYLYAVNQLVESNFICILLGLLGMAILYGLVVFLFKTEEYSLLKIVVSKVRS